MKEEEEGARGRKGKREAGSRGKFHSLINIIRVPGCEKEGGGGRRRGWKSKS